MCFRLKHFPAHHNDRTSLTSAVISEFKVHEVRQRRDSARIPLGKLTALPIPSSWIRGGEGDKEGGELGKERREREGKEGNGRGEREGEEGERETGKGRGGTLPSFERN